MLTPLEYRPPKSAFQILLVVGAIFISALTASAAKLIIVAPGETFTPGSGFGATTPDDQIAGVPFTFAVNSITDATNQYFTTYANVTFSATTTSSFNPTSHRLDQSFGGVIQSGYSSFATTLSPGATGDFTIATGTSDPAGVLPGSKAVHVFRMTKFAFTLPSSWTAGQVYYVTVTAQDASNATVTPYNGTVSFRAINGGVDGSTSGTISTVAFTDGVGYPRIELLYAGSNIQLQASSYSPNPGTVTTTTSASFSVTPGSATKFLIVGPSQLAVAGSNTINGRIGTVATQTVGSPFTVDVFAVDNYWNKVTSSTAAVQLAATDLSFGGSITPSGSVNLVAGTRQFTVNLRRVLSGSQILTATGALTQNTDTVPLTHATLDRFGLSSVSSPQEAGTAFNLVITAYDVYGNTCTTAGSVPGSVTMSVSSGVAFDSTSYSPTSILGTAFSNGIWSGNFRVYRRALSVMITATDGSVTGDSNAFDVNFSSNSSLYRYIVVMPGQTYTPGENHSGWGRNGSANAVVAGSSVGVQLYATDAYGNQLVSGAFSGVTANLSLERTDAASTLPTPRTLSNGTVSFNMTLTTAYSSPNQQRLIASGGVPVDGNSGYFTVQPTVLHHFSVGNIGSTQTAGNAFSPIIAARDIYENVVTSFSGPVYVTCPNLDYHTPEQSVIAVSGGTATGVTWTVSSGFSSGQWSGTITVFRVGNPVTLFVASQANGTGYTGTSSAFQVLPNTLTKTFMIVPGLQYRPGTGGGIGNSLGGYSGTPDAQQAGTPFSVTVYATDAWWNQVSSTGPFHLFTQPNTSNINGTSWNFNGGNTLVATVFNNADSYKITADYDILGVADYTTPYFITAISIHHFTVSLPGGASLPTDIHAGVPLAISITAYTNDAETVIASTFNGQVNLMTNADWDEAFRVISPQRVNFSGGVWSGNVTLYRAMQSGVTIKPVLGAVPYSSIQMRVHHNFRKKMLAIAPGMNVKPGISPDVYPPGGFPGYTGNPEIQEAGEAITMDFFLTDEYYNVITATSTIQGGNDQIRISSSDPYPATLDGNPLARDVFLGVAAGFPAGAFRSANFKLYTVGSNGYQTVTVENLTHPSVTSFTLGGNGVPPINVKHTYLARQPRAAFAVSINSSVKTAGVPFSTTITALDEYGNVMDDRNGASAFSPSNNVSLSSGSATNTLYPTIVQIPYNGVGYPILTCYKNYEGVGNSVTASFSDVDGSHFGSSAAFDVRSNVFSRLIPIVPNMDINGGGRFLAEPPTTFIGYTGSPATQTAGQTVNLRVYACDAYGNITKGATDFVSITSTDPFAPIPVPVRLDAISGYANFTSFKFHRASPASITGHNDDNVTIANGTTPNMLVNPAPAYGLSTVAPGQTLVEGSGNSNYAANSGGITVGGWYSGVTPTEPQSSSTSVWIADPEISGAWFPVTIVATDVFGNRRYDVADEFQVQGNDDDNEARPRTTAVIPSLPFEIPPYNLVSGMGWVLAKLITIGQNTIYPYDVSNSFMNHGLEIKSSIQVVTFGQTYFKVWVNGVESPGPVTVQASPSPFTVVVEVRDDTSHKVVRTANVNFRMEVTTQPGSTTSPGNGILNVTFGQTIGGVATISNQTYTVTEPIYIKVSQAESADRPTFGYSPEIRVSASAATRITMDSDAAYIAASGNYELQANERAQVRAHVFDANNNPITGSELTFAVPEIRASKLVEGFTYVTSTTATTDGTGTAVVTFSAGARNEIVDVMSTDGTIAGNLVMNVTVTKEGGVYPNPFNPLNPDQHANIDYRLEQNAPVKVEIFTLFGDLVWHKQFISGAEGARAGVNSIQWDGRNDKGVTIANGGYIVVIKVNDQEKYRFKLGAYKEK